MKTLTSIAAGGLAAALAACNKPASFEDPFSPVYREFDSMVWQPVAKLSDNTRKETGSLNSKTKRGNRQINGVLELSAPGNCPQLLRQIEEHLSQRTAKFHVEDDLPESLTGKEKTVHTLWMYNWGARHGKLHLWLFPFPDGNRVAFAAYEFEEPLR